MAAVSSPGPLDPRQAFQIILELFDASIDIMRQNLRRQHPEADEAEIETMLQHWLMKADKPLSAAYGPRGNSP